MKCSFHGANHSDWPKHGACDQEMDQSWQKQVHLATYINPLNNLGYIHGC